jgi:hypothetical protein
VVFVPSVSLAFRVNIKNVDGEQEARQKLSNMLLRVSRSVNMRERTANDSGVIGKNINRNDGNSSESDTTYHSYVWDYCLGWMGGLICERWLDAYVSHHGVTAERSPLEALIAKAWLASLNRIDKNHYRIWRVKTNGALRDVAGKLDRRSLTKWEVDPGLQREIKKMATKTANQTMSVSYDDNAEKGQGEVMPNMEALRSMAGRWTKMMRNRLVANLGEIRAAKTPIEFALGEDKAECETYASELSRDPDPWRMQPRIRPQPLLEPETVATDVQRRYALCMKMKQQSVYTVNPTVAGDDVTAGDRESEVIDAWRSRVNIAAIDYGGIDPNSVPKPSNAVLTREEVTSEVSDYDVGGREYQVLRQTNAETLNSYNQALAESAAAYKAVAARSSNVVDVGDQVKGWQVKMGSVDLVKFNDLTPLMQSTLKGTNHPAASATPVRTNRRRLEIRPSQLTVRSLVQ